MSPAAALVHAQLILFPITTRINEINAEGEIDRLRAENQRLVEACKLGLRVIEELVATDTGVALVMRAPRSKGSE